MSANAERIAAIITEPVMLNTGGILPKEGYLQHLRKVATTHGVVLIFDEVITGFRVALGGAQELYGVSPGPVDFCQGDGGGLSGLRARRAARHHGALCLGTGQSLGHVQCQCPEHVRGAGGSWCAVGLRRARCMSG